MKLFAIFTALVLSFQCYDNATCQDGLFRSLDMDGTITVEGNPELDPQVTVIFSFMLKPEGTYYRQMALLEKRLTEKAKGGDTSAVALLKNLTGRTDHARLLPDTNIEYLTNTEWVGKMEPMQKYTLTAMARLRHKMPTQIMGIVEAFCGTADTVSSCATINIFSSDTFFRDVETTKPTPLKPDTLWKDGHPIIIQTICKPILQIDTIPPVEKIEGPVPPHRQPEKKTISAGCPLQSIIGFHPCATPKLVWGCLISIPRPDGRGTLSL
jgi:hypothetical protein